jgi:hypothetical protein
MIKRLLVIFFVGFAFIPISAETLWRDRNIYTSEILNNGDVVMVEVEDISQ